MQTTAQTLKSIRVKEWKSVTTDLHPTNHGYHKLILYQKAFELLLLVYKLTKKLPREEKYILLPQIRRAAISIVANIVEGYSKSSSKEFVRFLDISRGSLTETELYFEICLELEYFTSPEYSKAQTLLMEVKRLIYSFQNTLRKEMSKN